MKKRTLPLLFALFLITATFVPAKRANAQLWNGMKDFIYRQADKIIPDIDITKTLETAFIELLTGVPYTLVTGRNADEVSNCALVWRDIDPETGALDSSLPDTHAAIANMDLSTEDLAVMNEAVAAAGAAVDTAIATDPTLCKFSDGPMGIADSGARGSGSLLAMTVSLGNTLGHKDAIPVNMAHFFKDYARRIPVVKNTAYAATYTYVGSTIVYEVWKVVRDISLGLMALFFLIIGMMIMTRKKINPQTVVTVQNVIPRVVISMILIFFSYPIGALLASLLMSLAFEAVPMTFFTIFPVGTGTAAWTSLLGYAVLSIAGLIVGSAIGGVGIVFAILLALVLIALIVVTLISLIKILIQYIKMLTFIILSPLYFALGAIPGKENMVVDWFKEMAVCVGSVMGSVAMIVLGISIAFLGTGGPSATGETLISRGITALFIPAFVIFMFALSLQMPKKVRGWIMGDKKK